MNGCRKATALMAFGFCSLGAFAQITNLSITPVADAFVRADAPLDNYGRAGSLAVAGASATNGFGLPGGRFDSLLRFPLADTVASLDAAFGHQDWFIARAMLRLNEVAAPANAILPRGAVGAFEVHWLAADVWTEGTGSPSVPTNDGVSYQALSSLLDPQRDVSLGLFTNDGLNGLVTFDLSLTHEFVEDLRSGPEVALHLLPVTDTLGFVFNSGNFGTDSARPRLELTAAPGQPPSITSIERFSASEVLIRFTTRSNWTQVLQGCNSLATRTAAAWTNLFTAPAQPFDHQVEVRDRVTSTARFYRLSLHLNSSITLP